MGEVNNLNDFDLDLLGVSDIGGDAISQEGEISHESVEVTEADAVGDVSRTEEIAETRPVEKSRTEIARDEQDSSQNEDFTPRERALLERLEQLTGERVEQRISQSDTIASPSETTGLPQTPQDTHNYLDGLDIDDVLSNSSNLNSVLIAVHNRAMEQAARLSAENIMRNLPRVISNYVSNHMTMKSMVDKFYEDNPELTSVKRTVGAIANEIHAANPELTTEEVFKRTADRTREILKISKRGPSEVSSPSTKGKPAFVRQKGRVKAPELQGIMREIDDLLV